MAHSCQTQSKNPAASSGFYSSVMALVWFLIHFIYLETNNRNNDFSPTNTFLLMCLLTHFAVQLLSFTHLSLIIGKQINKYIHSSFISTIPWWCRVHLTTKARSIVDDRMHPRWNSRRKNVQQGLFSILHVPHIRTNVRPSLMTRTRGAQSMKHLRIDCQAPRSDGASVKDKSDEMPRAAVTSWPFVLSSEL